MEARSVRHQQYGWDKMTWWCDNQATHKHLAGESFQQFPAVWVFSPSLSLSLSVSVPVPVGICLCLSFSMSLYLPLPVSASVSASFCAHVR